MSGDTKPAGAHLVGSAPYDSAEEMFRASMEHLGGHLKRLADGEVGERDDAAYFAPLANLALSTGTALYLGLVHDTDGKEGTMRRLKAASSVISDFGIATECGLGRRERETIPGLLGIHQELCG